MKIYTHVFLAFLLLSIFSCSQGPLLFNESEKEIDKHEVENATDATVASAGFDINWCIQACNLARKECFDWATENRTYALMDCESIRIVGVEVVDVYCEEEVIIGYEEVEVYSPEGELIRIDKNPIYGVELVLCGEEEQNILSNDPEILAEYEDCKLQALKVFVNAVDECDVALVQCEESCRGPRTNEGDQ